MMRSFAFLALLAALAGCGKQPPPAAPPAPPPALAPPPIAGGNAAPPPGDLNDNPPDGAPAAASPFEWGWLGLSLRDLGPDLRKSQGVAEGGALVGAIADGSPAKDLLRVNDILLSADDQPIASIPAFLGALRGRKAGAEMSLTLLRDKKEEKVVVKVVVQKAKDLLAKATNAAVAWLKKQQRPDGAWEYPHPSRTRGLAPGLPHSAVSALVLAALAGVPAEMRGQTDEAVTKGLAFLKGRVLLQPRTIGKAVVPPGVVDSPDEEGIPYRSYATALTAIALARHKGAGDEEALGRVLDGLRRSQLAEERKYSTLDWMYGSWNTYDGQVEQTLRGDVSCVSFVLQAFYEAGVPAEDPAIQKALRFVKKSQNLSEGTPIPELDDGGIAFNPRTGKAGYKQLNLQTFRNYSYGSATADGLRCLMCCLRKKDDPRVASAFGWLSRNYSVDINPGFSRDGTPPSARFDLGIFFYYLHSLSQAFDLAAPGETVMVKGSNRWWAVDIVRKLSLLQTPDGTWQNSVELMNEDDPNVSTALGLLTLDVLARHIP